MITDKEYCLAKAEQEIAKRKISFDDVERVTGMIDTHKHGSDASRRKRASAVAQFKRLVMSNPSILNDYQLNN